MFYQMIRAVLWRLQNVYEKIFYATVKGYRRHVGHQLSTELPELVTLFMTELHKSERHSPSRSQNIGRLIQSYSANLVHSVSRSDTIIAKHFLLALGGHNITCLQLFLRCLFAQYDILQ